MPSSGTFRSQPPKIGIQYPNRIASRRLSGLFLEQPPKEVGYRPLRRPGCSGLDSGVVVRRGVDVIGNEPAVRRLDELKAGDLNSPLPGKVGEPADDRMIEIGPEREQIGAGRLVDRAGVGRAELEATKRGISGDRVDELTVHELRPGDARLGGPQVLLQQRHAVHRGLVFRRADVVVELVVAGEEANPQPLAALVVLADERGRQLPGRSPELADPGHRDGPRHVESGCSQGGVLVNLAHLQLKHPPAVHHPATVSFQPAEHPAGLILRVRVAAGMRGRAHPGPEHPGGRLLIKIEQAVAEQPLLMRDAGGVERGPDRRVPVRVLVDHMDLHRCPAVRYAAAVSRNTSLAAGSPTEILAPSPANGRMLSPARSQASAKSIVAAPSRSQTKFASVGGTVQPIPSSSRRTRSRSQMTWSTRAVRSGSAASEATAAACASAFTEKVSMVLRAASATGSCPIRYPTRRPASPYALEKVRSTATFGRSRYSSIPSGTSGSRTYWTYASSSTTRQSAGTWSRNSLSAARDTTAPVGLFGVQMKISLVALVIAAAMAGRSWLSSRSGTWTEVAPARSDRYG